MTTKHTSYFLFPLFSCNRKLCSAFQVRRQDRERSAFLYWGIRCLTLLDRTGHRSFSSIYSEELFEASLILIHKRRTVMITSEKEFGRYVLTPSSEVFKEDATDDMEREEMDPYYDYCSCVIPPQWTALQLIARKEINHDTAIFTFALPRRVTNVNSLRARRRGAQFTEEPVDNSNNKGYVLGLPSGAFLLCKAPGCEHGGGDAIRPYTSISPPGMEGKFVLLVKRYDEWGAKPLPTKLGQDSTSTSMSGNPYRPPGAVSNYIHSLQVRAFVYMLTFIHV